MRPATSLSQVPVGRVEAAEIEAAMTPAGGWTRATLTAWGVPWPPPRGWRERLTRRASEPRRIGLADGLWAIQDGFAFRVQGDFDILTSKGPEPRAAILADKAESDGGWGVDYEARIREIVREELAASVTAPEHPDVAILPNVELR